MMSAAHSVTGAGMYWALAPAVAQMTGTPLTPSQVALHTVVAAGFATFPDLDTKGSTAARSGGLPTRIVAIAVDAVTQHRNATHSVLVGLPAFTLAAWAAERAGGWRLAFLLWFVLSAGCAALTQLQGKRRRRRAAAVFGPVGMAAVTYWVMTAGFDMRALPHLAALGIVVHIAGDWPTNEGIGLFWPLSRKRWGVTLFKVNSPFEWKILLPLLTAASVAGGLAQLGVLDDIVRFAYSAYLSVIDRDVVASPSGG